MNGSYSVPIGKQARAEHRPRKPERGEQQEQIALGDAQFDVLTLRRHAPALCRDDFFLAERVGALGAIEDAAAVDPGAEVGRDRNIGRGRDDTTGERVLGRRERTEDAAEGFLGREIRPRGAAISAGTASGGGRWRRADLAASGTSARNASNSSGGRSRPAKRSHSAPAGTPMLCWKEAICCGFISPA